MPDTLEVAPDPETEVRWLKEDLPILRRCLKKADALLMKSSNVALYAKQIARDEARLRSLRVRLGRRERHGQ